MSKARLFSPKPDNTESGGVTVKSIPIPYVPVQVTPKDLYPNHMLLTDEEIVRVKLANIEEGRHSKKSLDLNYGIVKVGGEHYAIYTGGEKALGFGQFGRVKLAQKLEGEDEGAWYALKVQQITAESGLHQALTEHEILIELKQSPRTPTPPRKPSSKGSPAALRRSPSRGKDQYEMVINLAKGATLNKLMDKEGEWIDKLQTEGKDEQPLISPVLRLQMAIDIIKEVESLIQEKHSLHRDLKVQNIVYDLVHQVASLIDFGSAKAIDTKSNCEANDLPGTTNYLAPELRTEALKAQRDGNEPHYIYNEKTEVYALGIVIAELFSLYDYEALPLVPSAKDPNKKIVNLPAMGNLNFIFKELDDNALFRFNIILKYDDEGNPFSTPQQRADINDLVTLLDLLHKMTAPEPGKRCSLRDAITALERIRNDYRACHKTEKISVGALNVDEYIKSDETNKGKLIEALQDYDEVWFIDTNTKQDLADYIKLKNELEKKGFVVGDQVFAGTDKDAMMKKLEKHLESRKISSVSQLITEEEKQVKIYSPRQAAGP